MLGECSVMSPLLHASDRSRLHDACAVSSLVANANHFTFDITDQFVGVG